MAAARGQRAGQHLPLSRWRPPFRAMGKGWWPVEAGGGEPPGRATWLLWGGWWGRSPSLAIASGTVGDGEWVPTACSTPSTASRTAGDQPLSRSAWHRRSAHNGTRALPTHPPLGPGLSRANLENPRGVVGRCGGHDRQGSGGMCQRRGSPGRGRGIPGTPSCCQSPGPLANCRTR